MAQVTVTINSRQFRMACEDGQEEHLQSLAADVDERIVGLRKQFGEIGDSRLTVMAAITAVDELAETKARVSRLEEEIVALQEAQATFDGQALQADAGMSAALNAAANRVEAIIRKLHQTPPPAGSGVAHG